MLCFCGASAQAPPPWPGLRLIRYAQGFDKPVAIAHAGDGSGRLVVVEQAGRIRIAQNGVVYPAPFLDISSRVSCCGEQGLLSVAFPPRYMSKQHFYVNYTDRAGDTVIARYRTTPNRDIADPASETILLTIKQPFSNHNGGQLAFSPKDGYLYIGMGDGGSAGDPRNYAQNPGELLGKVLRIDVEAATSALYQIPSSNPFVNSAGYRGEIWALGLRNPWRFSFDRSTGDLYIADVGQDRIEEVNYQPAASKGGENYGWNRLEGSGCFQFPCTFEGLTLPVAEYSHSQGCSVTGGYVYRGAAYPLMQGLYFISDFCSGTIWGLRRLATGWQSMQLLPTGVDASSFGEDEAGNLYLTGYTSGSVFWVAGSRPAFEQQSVVNAASFEPGLSPGSIYTLFGSGLTMITGIVQATSTPLPTSLKGTALFINNTAVPLFAVANVNGQEQINFQVPYELAGVRTASIEVDNNGWRSPALSLDVVSEQPGIFLADGVRAAALHLSDYQLITGQRPAEEGETIILFTTGLGPVDFPPPTGMPAQVNPLSRVISPPRVMIDRSDAEVLFAGLAPGFAGLYQINVRLPRGLPSGALDLVVSVKDIKSKPAKLDVR